jgi:hypothetical protein
VLWLWDNWVSALNETKCRRTCACGHVGLRVWVCVHACPTLSQTLSVCITILKIRTLSLPKVSGLECLHPGTHSLVDAVSKPTSNIHTYMIYTYILPSRTVLWLWDNWVSALNETKCRRTCACGHVGLRVWVCVHACPTLSQTLSVCITILKIRTLSLPKVSGLECLHPGTHSLVDAVCKPTYSYQQFTQYTYIHDICSHVLLC